MITASDGNKPANIHHASSRFMNSVSWLTSIHLGPPETLYARDWRVTWMSVPSWRAAVQKMSNFHCFTDQNGRHGCTVHLYGEITNAMECFIQKGG